MNFIFSPKHTECDDVKTKRDYVHQQTGDDVENRAKKKRRRSNTDQELLRDKFQASRLEYQNTFRQWKTNI